MIKISDKKYDWLRTNFAAPFIIDEQVYWCPQQFVESHKSKAKDYRKSIVESVSFKQMNFLSSKNNMKKEGYEEIKNWDKKRIKLSRKAQEAKFLQNPLLANMLVKTYPEKIVFDVSFDSVLGTGKNNDGENKLGEQLERIREKLISGELTPISFSVPSSVVKKLKKKGIKAESKGTKSKKKKKKEKVK